MVGLRGKLICQTCIQTDGDVFHEIFGAKPHNVHTMTPKHIQGCDLHEGEFGKVGAIVNWKYTLGGKEMVAKERVEALDEAGKTVTYKVVGGDLLQTLKRCLITVHVDTSGEDNLVTWTFDYEKLDENVKDPTEYLDLVLSITKDIENHHLPK